ncbi:MAG: hypothetical protein JSR24_08255 [Proteobacteria bacterium]|nr:hypothetical protein [Pseudomonadota bacterium]
MTSVYFLYHIDEQKADGHHHGKLLGVFSAPELARATIQRVRDQPGFRDFPERWKIYKRTLDLDSWTEGFVKETHERIR